MVLTKITLNIGLIDNSYSKIPQKKHYLCFTLYIGIRNYGYKKEIYA